jgi:hypothetical protein
MFFVLKFELILIIGSNNVLTEGARKVYRGRRVGQGWSRLIRSLIVGLILALSNYRRVNCSSLVTIVDTKCLEAWFLDNLEYRRTYKDKIIEFTIH